MELYSGETLFKAHDDIEHLALMEAIIGRFPHYLISEASPAARKWFNDDDRVRWPELLEDCVAAEKIRKAKPLAHMIAPQHEQFYDLIRGMLEYDPELRLSAKEALEHPFFRS